MNLESPDACRASHDEEARYKERQLGVGRESDALPMEIVQDVPEDQKADAAQDDQKRNREVDQQIASIRDQVLRKQREPSIVESRDGMKDAQVNGAHGLHLGSEPDCEDNRAGTFDQESDHHDDL